MKTKTITKTIVCKIAAITFVMSPSVSTAQTSDETSRISNAQARAIELLENRPHPSETAPSPAFPGDQQSIDDAIADVDQASAKRVRVMEEANALLTQAHDAYRNERSNQNYAKSQKALAALVRADIETRHELAHVAREGSRMIQRATQRFEQEIQRLPDVGNIARARVERIEENIESVLDQLERAGITADDIADPGNLPIEAQAMIARASQMEQNLVDLAPTHQELETRRAAMNENSERYLHLMRATAASLELLAWTAEDGIEDARLIAEHVNSGITNIAIEEFVTKLANHPRDWPLANIWTQNANGLGPAPMGVAVPNASVVNPNAPGLQNFSERARKREKRNRNPSQTTLNDRLISDQ